MIFWVNWNFEHRHITIQITMKIELACPTQNTMARGEQTATFQ